MIGTLEDKRLCKRNSGNTYGHEWETKLYQTDRGGFYVEVNVDNSTMETILFKEREDAINAGYRTLSDLLGEGR
jgi:hypothetical protein